MTPEEKHEYNKRHAVAGISYPAVASPDAAVAFREWIEKWLSVAYEMGFNNAKKGEL